MYTSGREFLRSKNVASAWNHRHPVGNDTLRIFRSGTDAAGLIRIDVSRLRETRSQNYTRMYSFGADVPHISKGLADGTKRIYSSLYLFRGVKRGKAETNHALGFRFICVVYQRRTVGARAGGNSVAFIEEAAYFR